MLLVGFGLLLLAGCSEEDKNQLQHYAFPGPDPRNATATSHYIFDLWKWGWIAAMITGLIVWALIFYSCWAFRRRSDDEVPVQTRYNLPLEIFYTLAPVIMVVVFFFHTVQAQNGVLKEVPNPDNTIDVVGQQWSWTFNYPDQQAGAGKNVWESGVAGDLPTLYLPVNETTQFNLWSPDVVHSFWIPGFLFKMDIIPGKGDPATGRLPNHFQVKPLLEGTYAGKCAELCGVSHSRMLFNVKVVSRAEFDDYLAKQAAAGYTSDKPLLGNEEISKQAGLIEQSGGTE